MKEFFKNKKVLIGIASVLIVAIVITGSILLFKGNKEAKDNKQDETTSNYVAYIKINPSIKLGYSQTCKNNECENPIVTEYELINEDAKKIFKDIDLLDNNKELYNVIDLITNTVKDNGVNFSEVEILSNWNNIKEYIETSSNNNSMYNVNTKNDKDLKEIYTNLIENQTESNSEEKDNEQTSTSENKENKPSKNESTSQSNKQPTQNKTDDEFKSSQEIAPGIYHEAGSGYGDYVKTSFVEIAGLRATSLEGSKFGCADAIDKKACKQHWIAYLKPKVERYEQEDLPRYEQSVKGYEEEYNRKLERYNEVMKIAENCKDEEYRQTYKLTCSDINPEKVKENLDFVYEMWQNEKNIQAANLYDYNQHKKAYEIYLNLPY